MKFNKESMPKHIAIIMDGNRSGQKQEENKQLLDIKKVQKLQKKQLGMQIVLDLNILQYMPFLQKTGKEQKMR